MFINGHIELEWAVKHIQEREKRITTEPGALGHCRQEDAPITLDVAVELKLVLDRDTRAPEILLQPRPKFLVLQCDGYRACEDAQRFLALLWRIYAHLMQPRARCRSGGFTDAVATSTE